jgi:predicted ArsR family transcriptional regulator
MDNAKQQGNRARMRDQCIRLFTLLSQRDRISIAEIGDILEMPPWTVRRWLNCFSFAMDLRIEKGVVVIEKN